MKSKLLYLATFILAFGIAGCSKTGPVGPKGDQGDQGDQGEQGAPGSQGIAGASGSIIYSGSGAPSADVDKPGDYYLDKSTGNLYGPKTDQGWGTPVNLIGQQGDQGAAGPAGPQGSKGDKGDNGDDGSQILSGTSAPASAIGKLGDYYWDASAFSLYGPKTSTGWGTGISLRGPKGDPGNANVISTGWFSIPAAKWTDAQGHGTAVFSEPGDLDWAVALNAPYIIKPADADGAILLYVNNGRGIRLTSFRVTVNSSGTIGPLGYLYKGTLEFRFVIEQPLLATDKNLYLYPIVALKDGNWDWGTGHSEQKYMQQTYLPSIEWKVVLIPTSTMRRSSPPPDPNDYKATCAYYGIPE